MYLVLVAGAISTSTLFIGDRCRRAGGIGSVGVAGFFLVAAIVNSVSV